MPELKDVTVQGFSPVVMDYDKIPYQTKIREKQRQLKLQAQKDGNTKQKNNKRKASNEQSWSKNKERALKRAKRKARRDFQRKQKHKFDDNELDELADEARLVKKLKTGKITKSEFDDIFIGTEESSTEKK